MSIELGTTPDLEKPVDKRTELHRRIDAKAEVFTDLRWVIEGLDSPLWSDSPEAVYLENRKLREVFEYLSTKMPDAYMAYQSQVQLLGQIGIDDDGVINEDDWAKLGDDIQDIGGVKDIDFVNFLADGIEGLISRRKRIRAFQLEWGEPDTRGGYSVDLQRFEDLPELPEGIGRYITRVEISRFSINIFIHKQKYDEVASTFNSLPSLALHLDNSLLNLIKDVNMQDPEEVDDSDFLASYLFFQECETLDHEEIHAIEDEFPNDNPNFHVLEMGVETQLASTDQESFSQISYFDGDIPDEDLLEMMDLRNLSDSSHEELLAEVFSKSGKDSIPSSTYAELGRKKVLFWNKLFDSARKGNGMFLLGNKPMSVKKLRDRIRTVYQKAQRCIPERLEYLDSLFIFILPSQFSLIEKTVDRWIDEERVSLIT